MPSGCTSNLPSVVFSAIKPATAIPASMTVSFTVAVSAEAPPCVVTATIAPVSDLCSLFMAISVAIISHNHNHVPIWRSRLLNIVTDYRLTLFYGFPAFGWIPTHNKNHHFLNNKQGDYTLTYRFSEKNNILTGCEQEFVGPPFYATFLNATSS